MSKSNTQWYPRYVGDYARKTAHLSLAQHGAYTLLMDWYYSNGKPLPLDLVHLHRICTAFAPDEQAAVQYVVENFFVKCDDGWHNDRVDEELNKRADISDKRRAAQAIREQKKGANAGANAPVLHDFCTPFAPPHPHPQSHIEKKDTIVSQKKNPRGCRLPDDWQPRQAEMDFAKQEGLNHEETMRLLAGFRDYWKAATGANATKLDWDATWRNWIRNRRPTKRPFGGNDVSAGGERIGPLTAAMRKFAAEAEAENDIFTGRPG